MLHSAVSCSGHVAVAVRDVESGRLVKEVEHANLVTTRGYAVIADAMRGLSPGVTHVGTGSGTTAATVADTALENEAYRDQVTAFAIDGQGQLVVRLFIGAASANGTEIREAGLFDASEVGNLIARVVFDPADQISKTSSITAQITWTLTFS